MSPEDQDEDVVAEHLRVSSGAASSDILQVNQLTKIYQQFKKKVHAVKRISVGIPAGEVRLKLKLNTAEFHILGDEWKRWLLLGNSLMDIYFLHVTSDVLS